LNGTPGCFDNAAFEIGLCYTLKSQAVLRGETSGELLDPQQPRALEQQDNKKR